MARFSFGGVRRRASNFRSRARSGYNNFKSRAFRYRSSGRRAYSSKTLGMKNSTLLKLAIVGVLGFMFKDKIKPFIDQLTGKK